MSAPLALPYQNPNANNIRVIINEPQVIDLDRYIKIYMLGITILAGAFFFNDWVLANRLVSSQFAQIALSSTKNIMLATLITGVCIPMLILKCAFPGIF